MNDKSLDYVAAHKLVTLEAYRVQDMLPKSRSNDTHNAEQADEKRTRDRDDGGKGGRGRGRDRGGRGGKGGKGKGGRGNGQADEKQRVKQFCYDHLRGSCTRTNCRYEHVSYEELGKQLKKGKSDNKADPATKKGKGADKSGEKNPKGVCL